MRIVVFSLLLSCFCFKGYSQTTLEHFIGDLPDKPGFVIPVDLDKDGFIDVISASYHSDEVSYYRNLDGEGTFSAPTTIATITITLQAFKMMDIDGDDDLDIVYKTNYLDKLAWIENLDGFGDFGAEHIISLEEAYVYNFDLGDLDNDGDIDVVARVTAPSVFERIVWFENLDGSGNFSAPIILEEIFDFNFELKLIDLDQDDDLDVVYSDANFVTGPAILWMENLGESIATAQAIHNTYLFSSDVHKAIKIEFADLNNDGQLDMVYFAQHDDWEDYLYWVPNMGGANFGERAIIDVDFEYVSPELVFADLDEDGDMDVISSNTFDQQIKIFKNEDGLGSFDLAETIPFDVSRTTDISVAPINSDASLDILACGFLPSKVVWFENIDLLNNESFNDESFRLYPNPTDGILTFQSDLEITAAYLYNNLGQRLSVNFQNNTIDLSHLSAGLYFLHLTDDSGNRIIERILKK